MKKILAKKNNRTGIKNHRSNKNKFRRSYKAYQIMTVSKKPGPSGIIKYDENGKVIGFIKWAGNKKQSEYTTKVAKDAINENKSMGRNWVYSGGRTGFRKCADRLSGRGGCVQ